MQKSIREQKTLSSFFFVAITGLHVRLRVRWGGGGRRIVQVCVCGSGGGGCWIRSSCCVWLCLSTAELVYTLPECMCCFFCFFLLMSEG